MITFHNQWFRVLCTLLFAFSNQPRKRQPAGDSRGHGAQRYAHLAGAIACRGSGTVSGYNVYRSPAAATLSYTKLNTALNAGLTYTDSSVSAGASYTYCVTTVDSLGEESVCSAPATANVPSNPNAPSAPLITVK